MQQKIYFDTRDQTLKKLAYSDNVYAWLLLHSYYKKGERHQYIYHNAFTFKDIAAEIHRNKDTVSKRFKSLIAEGIIEECVYNGKRAYKLPYFQEFETLDGPTVMGLLTLPVKDQKEELIKTYAWLLKKKRQALQTSKIETGKASSAFYCSPNQILEEFGHSTGNNQGFDRMRLIFTILQGADIIKYQHIKATRNAKGQIVPPQFLVLKVNVKASDKWLGLEEVEEGEE